MNRERETERRQTDKHRGTDRVYTQLHSLVASVASVARTKPGLVLVVLLVPAPPPRVRLRGILYLLFPKRRQLSVCSFCTSDVKPKVSLLFHLWSPSEVCFLSILFYRKQKEEEEKKQEEE